MSIGLIRAADAEHGRALVNKYREAGFDQIKVYSSLKPDVLKAITDEAHKHGLTAYGHVPFGMTAFQGVDDGMDGIEHFDSYIHPVLLGPGPQRFGVKPPIDLQSEAARNGIEFFRSHHTVIGPTMALAEWIGHAQNTPVAAFEPGINHVAPELRDALEHSGVPASIAPRFAEVLRTDLQAIAAMRHAGITIIAGTDQAVPGYSLYRELELYVQGGMTPLEAIQTATTVPARVMKRGRRHGVGGAGQARRPDDPRCGPARQTFATYEPFATLSRMAGCSSPLRCGAPSGSRRNDQVSSQATLRPITTCRMRKITAITNSR
jgi:hypothetical protein